MFPEKICLGQIGYGRWGKILFRNFLESPGFQVAKVTVKDLSVAHEGLGEIPLVPIDSILNDPQINAVVLASPLSIRYEQAKMLLESGKHLFIEKPLTTSPQQSEELLTIAEQKGLKVVVDYTFTFSAAISQMRALIKDGTIGEISAIQMSMQQLGVFGSEDVYYLLASHMLSILNLLIPLDRVSFKRTDPMQRERVTESGLIFFRSESCNGDICISLNNPEKERKITIYGSKGTLVYNMLAPAPLSLTLYEVGREKSSSPIGQTTQYYTGFNESQNLRLAVKYFYDVLRGIQSPNIRDAVLIDQTLYKIKGL